MSQNTASLVDRLLAAMTLEDKIAQLNMPLPDMIPGAAAGQDALDADNPIRRFIEGRLTPALGAGGGVFHTLPFAGVTPAEQAEFHNALQALTAQTRHGIPLLIVAEGTHGVVFPGATIFPEGPGLGSMWNLDRVAEVYGAVAAEARALGVHFICTVVIEPTRDPRLGRSVEAYTEDVLYTAWIAKTILDAAQGESLNSPDTVGVVFCHFPGQSEPQAGLERGAMHISERKLRSVFLPPWESVTGPGAAASVMATYAAIDGKPTHGSAALLTGLLRDELGFDGIVLSEGNGLRTLEYEGTATGQQDAGRQAIHAGVDVSITWEDAYLHPLRDLVLRGVVPEAEIDRAVRRVLAMKDRLGLFDSVQVDPARSQGRRWGSPSTSRARGGAREHRAPQERRSHAPPERGWDGRRAGAQRGGLACDGG